MAGKFTSRGFKGRRRETDASLKGRIPPGQYETKVFPVLSAGPTARTSLEQRNFSIYGEIAEELKWTWDEFQKLPVSWAIRLYLEILEIFSLCPAA